VQQRKANEYSFQQRAKAKRMANLGQFGKAIQLLFATQARTHAAGCQVRSHRRKTKGARKAQNTRELTEGEYLRLLRSHLLHTLRAPSLDV
jgi:hypothetical protein